MYACRCFYSCLHWCFEKLPRLLLLGLPLPPQQQNSHCAQLLRLPRSKVSASQQSHYDPFVLILLQLIGLLAVVHLEQMWLNSVASRASKLASNLIEAAAPPPATTQEVSVS